jgi:hypothetical protein
MCVQAVSICQKVILVQMQVASFHEAKKQRSDMFSSNGPGRLVVFEDGGIGFFWTEDEQPILVKYNRIDADLLSPPFLGYEGKSLLELR